MSDFKIIGNPNPVVGVTETYSIDFFSIPNISAFQVPLQNHEKKVFENQVKWTVHVLERGRWRQTKENEKHGNPITYTFFQRSLTRDGLRIKAEINELSARIDIKPQNAEYPRILAIDLLDSQGNKPIKQFAYGGWFIARIHAIHMERRRIFATLWEDDSKGSGHNKANTFIKSETGIVKEGIADIKFFLDPSNVWLANAKLAPGDQNEGKNHEYYITAEFFFNGSPHNLASNNINVPNPDYKPESLKQTPAEQKGLSKKDTKGINKAENKVFDYHETKVSVKPVIEFNPVWDKINSVMKVWMPDDKNKKENTCVCKEYDLVWGAHPNVNCDFKKKVIEISKKQNFDPNHLMAVMWVETNKTFSTSLIKLMPTGKLRPDGKSKKENRGLNENEIKNLSENFSGAVGLIQFTPVAIDELNNYYNYSLTKRKLALMTQLQQLDYVEKYIEFWIKANKIKTKLTLADLYLLVFSPSKMNGSNDSTTLYKEGTVYYNANKSIDTDKENGITKKELAHRAYESFKEGNKKENKTSNFICGVIEEKKIDDVTSTGVLEEMKIIADSHREYLQETDKNRTADTEAGLAKMDCSEFVSRYLHKLGITKNIIYMTTANMVSESAFRKVIENDNIDLVNGSKLEGFKPQRGDVFAWGYSKNGSWAGHTGVVYAYDETEDVVTILESIGSHGAMSETNQVNNGGYSGKGCTRTAKYSRLKGALYGHTGWHGYFRPKNYTKKL